MSNRSSMLGLATQVLFFASVAGAAVGCGDSAPSGAKPKDAAAGAGGTGGTGGAGGVGSACTDPTSATGDGCAGMSLPKCALAFSDPTSPTAVIGCTSGGAVATGQACDRPNNIPGIDTCADGSFCSALGVASGRVCRRVCSMTQATCQTGEGCFELQPPYGTCRPSTCDPFAATSPCPQGNTLAPTQVCIWGLLASHTASAAQCTVGGTALAGAACNPAASPPVLCAQGSMCLTDNVCHRVCDTAHACPTGQTCQAATYDDGAGGTINAPGPQSGGWCN